jgi:hypothetical protein
MSAIRTGQVPLRHRVIAVEQSLAVSMAYEDET